MNRNTRAKWNQAVEAQQNGETKKQWVDKQAKQAVTTTEQGTVRKVADVVWGARNRQETW